MDGIFAGFTASPQGLRTAAKRARQEGSNQNKDDDESKLSFKVAKILGFSFFCDWQDIDQKENGGIDVRKI